MHERKPPRAGKTGGGVSENNQVNAKLKSGKELVTDTVLYTLGRNGNRKSSD